MKERRRRARRKYDPAKQRRWRLGWIERTRAFLRKRYGDRCNGEVHNGRCDERRVRRLEFAHIKPTGVSGRGRGRIERLLDVLNNPECYTLMCSICHLRYDADHWRRVAERAEARWKEAEAAAKRGPVEPPF